MKVLLISGSKIGDYSFGGGQRDNYLRDALCKFAEVDTILWQGGDPPYYKTDWGRDRVLAVGVPSGASKIKRYLAGLKVRHLVRKAEQEACYDFIVVRHFPRTLVVPFNAHSKMIVDADDLRSNDLGSIRRRITHKLRMTVYRSVGRRARHIWFVEQRDYKSRLVSHNRTSLLYNVARGPERGALVIKAPCPRILMIGLYAYPPNAEGLLWFVRSVLPKVLAQFPDLELHAIGKYFQPELQGLTAPVIMRGFVEDLDAEYAMADVVVCPIQTGTVFRSSVLELDDNCTEMTKTYVKRLTQVSRNTRLRARNERIV